MKLKIICFVVIPIIVFVLLVLFSGDRKETEQVEIVEVYRPTQYRVTPLEDLARNQDMDRDFSNRIIDIDRTNLYDPMYDTFIIWDGNDTFTSCTTSFIFKAGEP